MIPALLLPTSLLALTRCVVEALLRLSPAESRVLLSIQPACPWPPPLISRADNISPVAQWS